MLGELRKILQKEIGFTGNHIPYNSYSPDLTIKNCKNNWLKENFSEWENTPYFLAGLYNLCVRMLKDTSLEDLKSQLRRVDANWYNKDYFIPGQEYYAVKIPIIDSPWRENVVSIEKYNPERGDNNYVSLSELREYLCDNPVLHCWTGFCEANEEIVNKLLEEGLLNLPNEDEKLALG